MPGTIAIIQARMGSTRLPGKVARKIADQPVLGHVIERCKKAQTVDQVAVATTVRPEDDPVVGIAEDFGIAFYRGDENDVLSRYYFAAKELQAGIIVRITADCPLLDPLILDEVVLLREKEKADYATNTLPRTYPRGVDVSVFTFAALEKTYHLARETWQREHVTPFMRENPALFSLSNLAAPEELSRPDLRLTVDTEEDLALVEAILFHLGAHSLSLSNIITLLDNQPWLKYINKNVQQKTLHP